MKRRVISPTLSTLPFALCGSVNTQQPAKIPRIGYIGPATTDPRTVSFGKGCEISAAFGGGD